MVIPNITRICLLDNQYALLLVTTKWLSWYDKDLSVGKAICIAFG